MCGRTSLAIDLTVLTERFDAHPAAGVTIRPRYNIAPRDDLLAIQNDAPAEFDLLEWGFIPQWADDPEEGPQPINARSETVTEKPMFREAFESRRCLIPADGFYEWTGTRGSKQPYRIERPDRSPFAYAGLWETWTPAEGEPRVTCTILTTDANEVVAPIHDRMPVILEEQHEETWLTGGSPDKLQSVLTPYPSEELHAYPVSTRVNSPRNDSADLLEALDIGDQSGLGDFAG
ncbi:SOS response-associated peptidase [Halorarum halophilum]|uniref:SOS response-associated peptidase n=1 Tax=Halorarum halophilum TaxID=2743090 RepID=A0A7D5H0T1_9EURY|nr:SOS response-associated peptidase [Halobaculum halophilum]QLG28173.1 SOS response-associated peptidase [Halobaculum halophilum]